MIIIKRGLGIDVFSMAIKRLKEQFNNGSRIVVSFSGGKDSGVCLELALIAAEETGNLPLDVLMRDEEIMFPGTFEYARRMADRKNIRFHWIIANQPIINIYNRNNPYYWVFDKTLNPREWVRQPPDDAIYVEGMNIDSMITHKRFPVEKGKYLVSVMGLRVSESPLRLMGLFSSKGYMTKPNRFDVKYCRPIFDWKDGDVWKAHDDYGWDFNEAYTIMHRLGLKRSELRIAPVAISAQALKALKLSQKAFPQWFEKVCKRLIGIRTAVYFGRLSVEPQRKYGETWEQCFKRTCLDNSPDWIISRCKTVMDRALKNHSNHSTQPFPQVKLCPKCKLLSSWRLLCKKMYMGDPFCMHDRAMGLKCIEPEFFRDGAGKWGGRPTW